MLLPVVLPVSKGNWILSSPLYLDLRTLLSHHHLKMPPPRLALTHLFLEWLAEPSWIQSWMARPWMKKRRMTTETWRTWTCLTRRLLLFQLGVSCRSTFALCNTVFNICEYISSLNCSQVTKKTNPLLPFQRLQSQTCPQKLLAHPRKSSRPMLLLLSRPPR